MAAAGYHGNHRFAIGIVLGLLAMSVAPAAPLAGATHGGYHPHRLILPSVSADAGETVVLPLLIELDEGLSNLFLDIEHNPNVRITNASLGNFPGAGFAISSDPPEGVLDFTFDENTDGVYILAYLGIEATGAPGSSSPLTITLVDGHNRNDEPIEIGATHGAVNINGPPPSNERTVSGSVSYSGSATGPFAIALQRADDPENVTVASFDPTSFPADYTSPVVEPGSYHFVIWKEFGTPDGLSSNEPISFLASDTSEASFNVTLDLSAAGTTGFHLVLRDPPGGQWYPGFLPGDNPQQGGEGGDGGQGGGGEPSPCSGQGSISGRVYANGTIPDAPLTLRARHASCPIETTSASGSYATGATYAFNGLGGAWTIEAWFDLNSNGEPDNGERFGSSSGAVDAALNRTDVNVQLGGDPTSGGEGGGEQGGEQGGGQGGGEQGGGASWSPQASCAGGQALSGRVTFPGATGAPANGQIRVRFDGPAQDCDFVGGASGDVQDGYHFSQNNLAAGEWSLTGFYDLDFDNAPDQGEPQATILADSTSSPTSLLIEIPNVNFLETIPSGSCFGTGSIAGTLTLETASNSNVMLDLVSGDCRHGTGFGPGTSSQLSEGAAWNFSSISGTVQWEAFAYLDANNNHQRDQGEAFTVWDNLNAAANISNVHLVLDGDGLDFPTQGGNNGGGPTNGGGGGFGCTRTYDPATTALVQGYVVDARRRAVEGANIHFQTLPGRSGEGFNTTNESGYYSCVIPGGRYEMNAWGDGGQSWIRREIDNGTTVWVNHTLSFNARPPYDWPTQFYGGTVWGNVTVGGAGVAGVRIQIFPQQWTEACNNWGAPHERFLRCSQDAETDANGMWVATGLANGTYNLQIDGTPVNVSSLFLQDAFHVEGANLVDEARIELDPVNFAPPAYIRGRVNTTGDAPVNGASVNAWPHCGPGSPGDDCGSFGWTQTDENGEYTLVVSAGRYGMNVNTDPMFYDGPPLSSARRDCHDDPHGGSLGCVVVTQGNTTWINFSMMPGHVLSGRVVKQVDGQDVPIRANIQAQSFEPNRPPQFAWGMTAHNNSGWFALTLEPGTYEVRIEPDRWENPDLGIYTNSTVVVPDVGDVHLGTIRLGQAAMIEGHVTGPDGEPIRDVNVFAHVPRGPGEHGPGGFGGWAHTDANGHYRLAVQPGTYEVNFEPPWGSSYMRTRNGSVTVTDSATTVVDVQLSEGGILTGYVLASDGTGVDGAFVDAWWQPEHHGGPGGPAPGDFPASGTFGHATTDANGRYVIRGLTTGSFGMYVRPPFGSSLSTANLDPMSGELPSVTIGATTFRNFTLSTGSTITGCVKDPAGSDAISFAWVSVFSRTGGFGGGEPTQFDGCFTIRGVRAGTYEVDVNPPFGSTHGRVQMSDVVVQEGVDVDLGEIRLRAGIQLTGRVVDRQGNGLRDVFVNAWQQHEGGPGEGPGAFGFAQTDANGNYVIRGLVAGKYGVHVQPMFNSGLSAKFIQDLRIPDTGLNGYEIVLGGGGWINGTVLGPDGEPIRGAWVGAHSFRGLSGGGDVTDANGNFNLSGLTPAEDYNVEVSPPFGRWDLARYHQFPLVVLENEGTLPGPSGNGSITLTRGGTLEGRVIGGGGAGVSGAFVNVGGQGTFGWGMTDEDGNFSVAGLSATNGASLDVHVQPPFGSAYVPSGAAITWAPDADTGVMVMGTITLGAGKNFSGAVVRGGSGVSDVDVHLWPSLDENGRPMGPPGGGSATTDAGGNFTVRGLSAGYYDVSLQPRDGSAGRFLPRGVLIGDANDTSDFTLSLETGGDLPILVTQDGSGTPIAGAHVDCFNPELRAGRGNHTDANGRTLLQGLHAGTYKCRVDAPGYTPKVVEGVTVNPGSNAEVSIGLAAVTTSTVTGRYANGSASSGYFVILVPADGDIGDGDSTGFNTTESDGAFVIPNMPRGSYDVKIVSPSGVLVALREDVLIDEDPEAVGDLTYDPNLGG